MQSPMWVFLSSVSVISILYVGRLFKFAESSVELCERNFCDDDDTLLVGVMQ